MKIAFYTPNIDIRGSCNALYYYAHYNETILGNTSVVVTPSSSQKDFIALNMFQKRFKMVYYEGDIDSVLDDTYDILYCIKHGLLRVDPTVSRKIKTVVHCVFDMTEPHGNVFVAVSETLARKFDHELSLASGVSSDTFKFVPHMIGLEQSTTGDNLRSALNIPDNGVVFGRYGGMDTFDLECARRAISRVVRSSEDVWFLFINTPVFDTHPRVIHLNPIIENDDKNRFISTCDAYLECGSLGHTFGIAMGEFSVNNKPIIAYNGPMWNTAHLDMLQDKAIYFSSEDELYSILKFFNPLDYRGVDCNQYKDYNPESVMKIFKSVFIDEE